MMAMIRSGIFFSKNISSDNQKSKHFQHIVFHFNYKFNETISHKKFTFEINRFVHFLSGFL